MNTSTVPGAQVPQILDISRALCDSFDSLISDYGILTGVFSLDNAEIRNVFSSRSITDSSQLAELDDKARDLTCRIAKAQKKEKAPKTKRRDHELELKALKEIFAGVVAELKDVKAHLESSFSFKYRSNCSYMLLGNVGRPPPKQIKLASIIQNTSSKAPLVFDPKSRHGTLTQSALHAVVTPSPTAADTPAGPDPVQPIQSPGRRSTRIRNLSAKAEKRDQWAMTAREVPQPKAKANRKHPRSRVGSAAKIANSIQQHNPLGNAFGQLAPKIQTPQQIWKHRFPEEFKSQQTVNHNSDQNPPLSIVGGKDDLTFVHRNGQRDEDRSGQGDKVP